MNNNTQSPAFGGAKLIEKIGSGKFINNLLLITLSECIGITKRAQIQAAKISIFPFAVKGLTQNSVNLDPASRRQARKAGATPSDMNRQHLLKSIPALCIYLLTVLPVAGGVHGPATNGHSDPLAGRSPDPQAAVGTGPETSLSDAALFSLLTASPGDALYSVFGHSALRVYDPIAGVDEVYNWGTFDFDTPNFYLKFLRGQLLYQLSVTTFAVFQAEYRHEGRAVYEQVLALSPEEKHRLYAFLQVNRQPEHRDYLYDFFYDNCSTRIRDLIGSYVAVAWDEDPFPGPERSFRDMLKPYLGGAPWAAFGIDLALGLPSDRIASPWEAMFLPDEMFMAFDKARRVDGPPLVASFRQVMPSTLEASEPGPFSPGRVMWLVFGLGFLMLLRRGTARVFGRTYFVLLGIGGLVVFFLWFLSDHTATNHNLVLLWMLPTHLYFAFSAFGHSSRRVVRLYFMAVFVTGFLLLLLWPWLPQGFHPGFFPLIALSVLYGLRAGFISWKKG